MLLFLNSGRRLESGLESPGVRVFLHKPALFLGTMLNIRLERYTHFTYEETEPQKG